DGPARRVGRPAGAVRAATRSPGPLPAAVGVGGVLRPARPVQLVRHPARPTRLPVVAAGRVPERVVRARWGTIPLGPGRADPLRPAAAGPASPVRGSVAGSADRVGVLGWALRRSPPRPAPVPPRPSGRRAVLRAAAHACPA